MWISIGRWFESGSKDAFFLFVEEINLEFSILLFVDKRAVIRYEYYVIKHCGTCGVLEM